MKITLLILSFALLTQARKEEEFVFEFDTECVTFNDNGSCIHTRTSGTIHEPVCFPETAKVYTKCENNSICQTKMKDLIIGQEILVDFEDQKFETVKGWLHRAPTMSAIYYGINVGYKQQLYISGEHLMLINYKFQRAKNVKIGDVVNHKGKSRLVNEINKFILRGAYTPWVTGSGEMIVDEFKVHSMSHQTDWAPNICWWFFNKIAREPESRIYDDDDYVHPTVSMLQNLFGIMDYSENLEMQEYGFTENLAIEKFGEAKTQETGKHKNQEKAESRQRRRGGHSNAGKSNNDDDDEDEEEQGMLAVLITSFQTSDQRIFFKM